MLGEVGVPPLFVVTTEGIEFETVHLTQSLKPGDVVVHHVVAPEVADPGGGAPRGGVEREAGIAALGLLHHPPHIATHKVGVVALVGVRWHGALRAVAVTWHLDEDGADAGTKHRLIDHVHNLRALRFGIVLEEDGGGTTTIDGSNAVELLTRSICAQTNGLCRSTAPSD